jgi:Endoplasmic Reticulum-Golgi Intermediate Compartment (ERGIC)
MYRKIPADLMEGSKRGSILSLLSAFVMLILFLAETTVFFQKRYDGHPGDLDFNLFIVGGRWPWCVHYSSREISPRSHVSPLLSPLCQNRLVTDLKLDENDEPRVRLNFNITMMDLKCEYAVVDVVSVLGTEQNVSSHVTKWHVDAAGVRQRYQGRNKQQKDIDLFDSTITERVPVCGLLCVLVRTAGHCTALY